MSNTFFQNPIPSRPREPHGFFDDPRLTTAALARESHGLGTFGDSLRTTATPFPARPAFFSSSPVRPAIVAPWTTESLATSSPGSIVKTIPFGLDPAHHLISPNNYHAWANMMLFYFREYGVLNIMRDAISPAAFQNRQTALNQGHFRTVISGAESATTADLDIWDSSNDMTLLLRADALIEASISSTARTRLAGITNVHEKWAVLRRWGTGNNQMRIERLRLYLDDLERTWDVMNEKACINTLMEIRAGLINRGYRFKSDNAEPWIREVCESPEMWIREVRDALYEKSSDFDEGLHPDDPRYGMPYEDGSAMFEEGTV